MATVNAYPADDVDVLLATQGRLARNVSVRGRHSVSLTYFSLRKMIFKRFIVAQK